MQKPKVTPAIIDYRNARYQGHVDSQSNRSSMGILVDDDLSFYVSQWNNNLLHGQTLVYISHGKYIYGEWVNNEPHGLNVFRTGDTVLVGEFQNGQIIGRILVIFQRYNIIAVLQKRDKQKFDVIECGKLLTHDDLVKYIEMLDVEMPENYFSLIKFVTSLTEITHNDHEQALIASPCEDGNCYFGYRDGLAIVFNSSNGVVSVGQHQGKRLSGFGGKFDGKKIQEGNFQLQQTILYHKKRPNSEIYAIFQKLHKRSLNFKNQYFDSKVKTLGDLQGILRGNIQKIVNYNMKNGIREATAGELNDSLDYQVMDQYESVKAEQNRQSMYEKEKETVVPMKKTVSSYYNDEREAIGKTYSKSNVKPSNVSDSNAKSKRYSKVSVQDYHQQSQKQEEEQSTARRTPKKDSTVYYAKKSPIRYKEDDRQVYEKQSRTFQKPNKNYERETKSKKYLPQSEQNEEQFRGERPSYSRASNISQQKVQQNNRTRSPMNYKKNLQQRQHPTQSNTNEIRQKIPKFGGLQLQETETPSKKNSVLHEVEEYKKQLERSRSKEKVPGQSLNKYLKRPNYEDIEERRKRLLSQFKELNSNDSSQQLKVSERTPHKNSIQIQIGQSSRNSYQKDVLESPCMKEKILSFNSQNDQATQNSSEGYLPLSLINNEKRHNRNMQLEASSENAFTKKLSTIDRLQVSNNKLGGKENNLTYTPGSFAKYKKNSDNIQVQNFPSEKKNDVRRFYCRENQQTMDLLNMTKKPSTRHTVSENQEEDQNQFQQIQLKQERTNKVDYAGESKNEERQGVSRGRQGPIRDRQVPISIAKERQDFAQKESTMRERDRSSLVDDISRRRKGYKYYFDQ